MNKPNPPAEPLTPESLRERLPELSERFLTAGRRQRFRTIAAQRLNCLTAVFEQFYDAHNVSAGIRSCEVFGCPDVHVITSQSYKPNATVAAHAQRWVNIHRYGRVEDCIERLRADGFTVVGTVPDPDAAAMHELPLPDKLCVWFGPERDGISERTRRYCDALVTIPMHGFTQSLNVSTALAVLMHFFSSAYRHSGRPVYLSAAEQEALLDHWCERDLRRQFGWDPRIRSIEGTPTTDKANPHPEVPDP